MKRILQVLTLLTTLFIAGIASSYAFELNGFADISLNKCTAPCPSDDPRNGSFSLGSLDLYLAENLDDVDILVELVVEDGDVVDLERLTIGYTFSDALRLRVGRFHTPLGFWNTSYHHGSQLQPTIDRPEFLKFEDDGGILPAHVVGTMLSGRVSSGIGALEYSAMIGNGPVIDAGEGVLSPNNTLDNNTGKDAAFNLALSPNALPGLKLGVSGHLARVDSNDDPVTVSVDQTIYAIALIYKIGDLDLHTEYFNIKDKDNYLGNDFTNNAFYGLVTYSLNDNWVPYLMYEKMSLKDQAGEDPYILALGAVDTEELIAGLRYNISYRSSVKVEGRKVIDEGGDDWNEYAAQWSLAF